MPPTRSDSKSADSDVDIRPLVLDPKIIEALATALAPVISKAIEKCFEDKISSFVDDLHKVVADNARLRSRLDKMQQEVNTAREEIEELKTKIESFDSFSRRDNIIIQGLKLQSYSD